MIRLRYDRLRLLLYLLLRRKLSTSTPGSSKGIRNVLYSERNSGELFIGMIAKENIYWTCFVKVIIKLIGWREKVVKWHRVYCTKFYIILLFAANREIFNANIQGNSRYSFWSLVLYIESLRERFIQRGSGGKLNLAENPYKEVTVLMKKTELDYALWNIWQENIMYQERYDKEMSLTTKKRYYQDTYKKWSQLFSSKMERTIKLSRMTGSFKKNDVYW